MKKFPVALQLYSVRNDLQEDFYGTLKKVKELGYDGVEFAGMYGHPAAEVKKMCEDLGLVALSAHVAYLDMMADPQGKLGKYADVGCKYVAIPYLTEDYRPGKPKFAEVVENAKGLGETCHKMGMQLLYHNHDFEFTKLDGKYALDVLYDTVPEDLLKTELDTCWVNVGGENPAKYLMKYAGRSPLLHLKDFTGEKSENMYKLIGIKSDEKAKPSTFEYRPVGYGKQNFPEILAAAEKAGVEWVVVEQDEPSQGNTPMECAKMSREYLKTLGL